MIPNELTRASTCRKKLPATLDRSQVYRRTFYAFFVPLCFILAGLSWMIISTLRNPNSQPNSEPTTTSQTASDASGRNRIRRPFTLPPFAGCVDPDNLSTRQKAINIGSHQENGTDANTPEVLRYLKTGGQTPLPVYDENEIGIAGPCQNEGVWDLVTQTENGEQHIYVSLPNPQDRDFTSVVGIDGRRPIADASGQLIGWVGSGYMESRSHPIWALDGASRFFPMTTLEDAEGNRIDELAVSPDDPTLAGVMTYVENGVELRDAEGNTLAREARDFTGIPFTTNPEACNRQLDQEADNYWEEHARIWQPNGFFTLQDDGEEFQRRLQSFAP